MLSLRSICRVADMQSPRQRDGARKILRD